MSAAPPLLRFRPSSAGSPVRAEVQRLDGSHFNVSARPHAHAFLEVMVIESGNGRHGHLGQATRMSAGGVCALAPGEVHDCTDLKKVEGWLVLFCADALSERTLDGPWRADPRWAAFRRAGADGRLSLSSGDLDRLVSGLEGLRQALDRPQVGHALAVGARLDLILLELAGHLADRAGGDLTVPSNDPLVAEVLGIIDRDFAARVSLARIAREVRRTPSHLTDRVRRVTGLTVGQWIIERRLAEARGLFSHTDLTVAEVAEQVGYVDVRHFTRHFGRAYGRAPAAWRRASRAPGHLPT